MRAGKKPSLKTDKKSPALGQKRGGIGYSKKTALLEDAITQMNDGKYGRSSAALKELLALDPLNMEARRLFATLHLRLGSLLPARQAFESLANEALERQDYWLAESLLREYLAAGPRCVPFIEKLGIVYQEKGDVLAAAEEFGKAIDVLIEDPDTEKLNWPADLYAKIRELAPASPPAFRLAALFDAQSGELLARPAAVHTEPDQNTVSPAVLETAAPEEPAVPAAMSEPVSGVMPWEQVDDASPPLSISGHNSESVTDAVSSGADESGPAVASPEYERSQAALGPEAGSDLRTEYVPDFSFTANTTSGEPVACADSLTVPEAPTVGITSDPVVTDRPVSLVEEVTPSLKSDQTPDPVSASMPWGDGQDALVTSAPSDAVPETSAADVVATESLAFPLSEAPGSHIEAVPQFPQQTEQAAEPVSAPMPWEQVQDATVIIPQADHTADLETRSASSAAAESPSFVLPEAAPVEPQEGSVPARTFSETASPAPEHLSVDSPAEPPTPSHSVWESVAVREWSPGLTGQPADLPTSPAIEAIPALMPDERVQEAIGNGVELSKEPIRIEEPVSEASLISLQDSPSGERDLRPASEPSIAVSGFSAVEEHASLSLPVADSPPQPEHQPAPEISAKPKSAGFSWESIFSTWKYGPSSSVSRAPVHQAPPADQSSTGEPLQPVKQSVPDEGASAVVHESASPETTPVTVVQSEPVASPMSCDQGSDTPLAIPSAEPFELSQLDPVVAIAAASGPALADASPHPAPVSDEPEVIGASTLTRVEEMQPVQVDPSPGVEPARSWTDSTTGTAPAPVVEPPIAVEPPVACSIQATELHEAAHPGAVSHEPPVQPGEFRYVSSSAATFSTPVEEAASREASSPAPLRAEPSGLSEEFQYASSGEATSSALVQEAASEPPLNKEEKPLDVGELIPPALTHETLPVLQTLVPQLSEAAKESPVASPKVDIAGPVHHEPEAAGNAEAPSPIAFTLEGESPGFVTESAQVPLQETEQPTHWKTGEVSVQPHRPSQTPRRGTAGEEAVAPRVEETRRLEPEIPSYNAPAAESIVSESQPSPLPEKEERVRTGESIRLIDLQGARTAGPAASAPEGSAAPAASTAASAVKMLFQSSDGVSQTHRGERTAVPTQRPRVSAALARLRFSLSAFIGSCFSTTHALIMSLVGLVLLSGTLLTVAVGAVGLTWVVMEEKPSPAFKSLTTPPVRSPIDPKKNGYLLLLGFDADAGADPIQAGSGRKPAAQESDAVSVCLGGADREAGRQSGGAGNNASASVAGGWFRSSNPATQFKVKADSVKDWVGQAQSSIGRYRQWLKLPFEDWGYGQSVAPPCAAILFAHRLYVAEGFAPGQVLEAGIHRLQDDMEAWRAILGQAKTLPVKTLALQAIEDDIAVASGLLVQPDFDGKELPALTNLLRPLDQVELSMRWPMQSELAVAAKTIDAQLHEDQEEEVSWQASVATLLPLPKQRRLNEYAAYYEASYKAAGEGRYSAMPKRATYVKTPPATVMDYFANPIENIVGLKPLPLWDRYNGMVVDTDARLRLASVQAWLRRGSQDGDLVTRIAKAGQRFYDPYTGLPMLVNLKRGVMYSVGHDGKDQDADPQQDVVVSVPLNPASQGTARPSSKSK